MEKLRLPAVLLFLFAAVLARATGVALVEIYELPN